MPKLVYWSPKCPEYGSGLPPSAWVHIILQEYPNRIILWTDPHHKWQEINTVNLRNTTGPYMLIPSLHVVGAIEEEFGPTKGITQLDNSLVIRHVEVVRSFLQGFLDLATKYAKIVSDDVVTPILKAHIVQTLFLQKQAMAQEWECLCFLQKEITQLQKWMVSAFPSPAAHIVHQQKRTQVETRGNTLEGKLCKPILNYCIFTTRQVKSTCYHLFPVLIPYQNKTYFLKITHHHLLPKSPKIKRINRQLVTYLSNYPNSWLQQPVAQPPPPPRWDLIQC